MTRIGSARRGGASVLDDLAAAGHLADIDRHFGKLMAEIDGGGGLELPAAAALASAWARAGHACLALPRVAGREWPPDAGTGAVRLPRLEPWVEALAASPLVARPGGGGEPRPLVMDGGYRLYLARFWAAEQTVAAEFRRLARSVEGEGTDADEIEAALDRLFAGSAPDDRQRAAVRIALHRRLCVVSGGPGTGKTTTVAAIVALLSELGLAAPGRIALAAPTGKAAARLQEAVRNEMSDKAGVLAPAAPAPAGFEPEAGTVHRLLLQGGRHGPLPIDALILDEGSMMDLTLMARLLSALPDSARLVVLGDASQLASVQPGSVFADLCRAGEPPSPLSDCVVRLVRNWRFDDAGGIGRLAAAVVRGDGPGALAALEDHSDGAIGIHPLPDPAAFERLAARLADERFAPLLREVQALRKPPDPDAPERMAKPLSSFRVLCAHRVGSFGAERFNRAVERRLRALDLVRPPGAFYPGRPLLVTRNDPRTGLANGDAGVVLRDTAGRAQVWFPELTDAAGRPRLVPPARLPPHESFFAVTVHRAQGSEYDEVAVVPGPADARVATRELLYTAVTRARRRVTVYAAAESVTAAVERTTERSSGLRDALALPEPALTGQDAGSRKTRSRAVSG